LLQGIRNGEVGSRNGVCVENIRRGQRDGAVKDGFGLEDALPIDDLTYDGLAAVVDGDVVERDVPEFVDERVQAVDGLASAAESFFLRH